MRVITRFLRLFPTLPFAVLTLTQTHAQLTTIVDNRGESSAGFGTGGSDKWFAQGFTTLADTTYLLNSVSLILARGPSSQGTYTVSFWDDTGPNGTPGTPLAVISSGNNVGDLSTSFTDKTFQSGAAVSLAPNTTYFVVLQASAPFLSSGLRWSDSDISGSTGPGQIGGWTASVDQGNLWTDDPASQPPPSTSTTFPFQIAVTATPVPEPALYSLVCGLGLLGGTIVRRWRRL